MVLRSPGGTWFSAIWHTCPKHLRDASRSWMSALDCSDEIVSGVLGVLFCQNTRNSDWQCFQIARWNGCGRHLAFFNCVWQRTLFFDKNENIRAKDWDSVYWMTQKLLPETPFTCYLTLCFEPLWPWQTLSTLISSGDPATPAPKPAGTCGKKNLKLQAASFSFCPLFWKKSFSSMKEINLWNFSCAHDLFSFVFRALN